MKISIAEEKLKYAASFKTDIPPFRTVIQSANEEDAQKLFDLLLSAAIRQRAEAVLIEPDRDRAVIRLQFEGETKEWLPISDPVLSRLLLQKIKDKAGKMGRFQVLNRHTLMDTYSAIFSTYEFKVYDRHRTQRRVDVELSSYPTPAGEALSMKVLRQDSRRQSEFQKLGFEPEMEERFLEAIHSETGMVVFTGPCNSGKSTATYAALRLLRDKGKKIVTLESEVHQPLDGVTQLEVNWWNKEVAKRWDVQMQKALEMDPDVLMVQAFDDCGFYNDVQQNPIIRYATNRGLVITAIHYSRIEYGTYRLACALPGVTPVGPALRLICAPCLVPVLCASCAEEYPLPTAALVNLGLRNPDTDRVLTWRSRGCPQCDGTGSKGKTGIYELMKVSPEMRLMLTPLPDKLGYYDGQCGNCSQIDHTDYEIIKQACAEGMFTKRELGLRKVLRGDCSLMDVVRSTPPPPYLYQQPTYRPLPQS